MLSEVLKLDEKGNFIESYESVTLASEKNDIGRSSIIKSASGQRKLGGGFKWVYRYDLSYQEYLKLIGDKAVLKKFDF